MGKRINWHKPSDGLNGMTPMEWLAENYPHTPRNIDLAKTLRNALDLDDVPLDKLSLRISRRASVAKLNKSDEAKAKSYAHRAEIMKLPLRPALRKFDDWLEVEADPVAITSEWHIPYWNERLARRLMMVCRHWNPPIKDLLIGGDLMDFEQFGPFITERGDGDGDGLERTARDDILHARHLLEALAEWFDQIKVIMGNHEARLFSRKLEQQIGYDVISMLWNSVPEKIEFSRWTWCILNGEWRISHPSRKWKQPGSLARALASKYQTNYVLCHSHTMSISYDISSQFIAIDSGGMMQPELMGYYVVQDDPAWAWCPGFVVISDGKPHVFNDVWTDWDFYREWLGIPLGWTEAGRED